MKNNISASEKESSGSYCASYSFASNLFMILDIKNAYEYGQKSKSGITSKCLLLFCDVNVYTTGVWLQLLYAMPVMLQILTNKSFKCHYLCVNTMSVNNCISFITFLAFLKSKIDIYFGGKREKMHFNRRNKFQDLPLV